MCLLLLCQMVVDALLLCFCEDSAINDGSAERPYYMNTSLMVNWLSIWFFVQMCCHPTLLWTLQLVSDLTLSVGRQKGHLTCQEICCTSSRRWSFARSLGTWPDLECYGKCVSKTDVENDGTCSTYIHTCMHLCMYVCMYVCTSDIWGSEQWQPQWWSQWVVIAHRVETQINILPEVPSDTASDQHCSSIPENYSRGSECVQVLNCPVRAPGL